ncbi:hypothetical protein B0O80DRAFT_434224 [Mortierella sp. GBAus27b]|nr:hypothetical protein B0O80DRAFT_434224 [Mortierella sp. GBAus27b]
MSYKGLKKIINSLIQEKAQVSVTIAASPPPGSEPTLVAPGDEDENSTYLQSQKAAFFFKLERELEKVNTFYLQKESELKVRLRSLIDKERVTLSRRGRPGTSSSINSLKEAYRQFEQDLSKLQKFVETNGTGFRKILKKWDKRSKSTTKELYLARQVDLQPCFNQEAMVELADSAAHHLLELENVQPGRSSVSAPSSPISTKPAHSQQTYVATSPMQQQLDDLETDLFNAIITNQSSVVQDILKRRILGPLAIQAAISESEVTPKVSNNEMTPEHAREVVSRLFWRCCSETGALESSIQQLVDTELVDFKFVDDISDRTCLHEIAVVGRLSLLKLAVEHGVSPDCMDVYGRRPLHYVSMYGHADCATYLLSLKTSMTATDHDGFGPFIYSVMNGHTKCVEIFLAHRAEVEASREGDPIPLSLACHFGHDDIALMLIERGSDLHASNADGLEPLHITCREGHARLTRILTTRGARVDQEDKYMCWTPLFYAASEGHVECVNILLEAGCNINVLDEHGQTPIYYAASEGHADCVELLVQAGGKAEGRPLDQPTEPARTGASSTDQDAPADQDADVDVGGMALENSATMEDIDMDLIPSLSLPPPIIPFRIYGHNYLDKKYQINLTLGHVSQHVNSEFPPNPVQLYGSAQISSLKLVISSKPDNGTIPHNVILPLGEHRKVYGFQVDSLDQFSIEFDIFPTFGSKAIGRAVALPNTFSSPTASMGKDIVPLFDARLKVVGELAFEYKVIRPFQGVALEVGGRLETYWKSTNSVDSAASAAGSVATAPQSITATSSVIPLSATSYRGILPHPTPQATLSGNTVPSYITASSLSGEYIQLSIQMTRDFVPVVFGHWRLPLEGFDVALGDITFSQFRRFKDNVTSSGEDLEGVDPGLSSEWSSAEWRRRICDQWMSLEQVLKALPKRIGVNLELKYPTVSERRYHRLTNTVEFNKFVDTVLQTVYASSSVELHRNVMFSSFNPVICSALNWKQPNYAVFFSTYGGYNRSRNAESPQLEEPIRAGLKRKGEDDQETLPSPKHGVAAATFPNLDGAQTRRRRSSASSTVTSSPTVSRQSPSFVTPLSPPQSSNGGSSTKSISINTNNTKFIETDRRCTSIKEAIKFARGNNLLGIICEATPLIQVPTLITHIKESGLILASFGASNRNPELVQIQRKHGVDALMVMEDPTDLRRQHYRLAPCDVPGTRSVGVSIEAVGSTGSSGTLESWQMASEVDEGVLKY